MKVHLFFRALSNLHAKLHCKGDGLTYNAALLTQVVTYPPPEM